MHDDDTNDPPPAATTPPLYQGKANDGRPWPPGAGLVYVGDRGEWLVDLNAEQRHDEQRAAELRRCTAPDWPGELPPQARSDGPWVITLFDGELRPSHSQIYLESEVAPGEPYEEHDIQAHFAGQHNGLCGGAIAGRFCLMTATHTGRVPVKVELHSGTPALDEAWEDVVELSLQVEPWRVALVPLLSDQYVRLPLPRGHYRLRCSARGMVAEWDQQPRRAEERYLLQLWRSAAREADRVVRVGSERARYLHQTYGRAA